MTKLSSNADLLSYLVNLEGLLSEVGRSAEAGIIRSAASTSTGLSAEFLGESLIAMKKIAPVVQVSLTDLQCHDFDRVIKQVEFALNR